MVQVPPKAHHGVVFVLFVALLLASCSGAERPSTEEWSPVWERVVAGVPAEADLGNPPDAALCSHALGLLRDSQADLFPVPDPAIDSVVNEWVRVAEDALFECPPTGAELPDMAHAYAELERLEAEVAVVLAIDRGDG